MVRSLESGHALSYSEMVVGVENILNLSNHCRLYGRVNCWRSYAIQTDGKSNKKEHTDLGLRMTIQGVL